MDGGPLLRALHDLAPRDARTIEQIARLLQASPAVAGPEADEPDPSPVTGRERDEARPAVTATTSASAVSLQPSPAPSGEPVRPTLTLVRAGPGRAPAWLRGTTTLPVAPAIRGEAKPPAPLIAREQVRGILSATLATFQETRRLDVARAVREIACGRELRPLPLLRLRAVAPRAQLLLDRSETMRPFLGEEAGLAEDMERVLGATALEVLRFAGCPVHGAGSGPRRTWSSGYGAHTPTPGTCVVVATDLGIGAPPASETADWLDFAAEVRRAGCRLVVFVPYGPRLWPGRLARTLHLVHWDTTTTAGRAAAFVRGRGLAQATRRGHSARNRDRDAERLAGRCAFAVRIDAALLRAARTQLLPMLDAGAEADVWSAPFVRFRSPDGIALDSLAADSLRSSLAEEDPSAYEAAWELTRRQHAHLPRAIRVQEELAYLHRSRAPGSAKRTRELLRGTLATTVGRREDLAVWAARLATELPPDMHGFEEVQMLRTAARLRLSHRLVDSPDLPDDELPDWLAWVMPRAHRPVPVGIRLFEGLLEFSEPPAQGARELMLPETRPLAVEVGGVRVEIGRGTTTVVPVDGESLIRTALGEEWALAPAPLPRASRANAQTSLSLEVLRAEHGDCLLLHHGDDLVLIDGGPSGIYGTELAPRFQELMAERSLPPDLALVIVSHVEDEHIGGLREMFAAAVDREENQLGPREWVARELWFNPLGALTGAGEDLVTTDLESRFLTASVSNGSALQQDAFALGIRHNAAFDGRLVRRGDVNAPFSVAPGLTLTVLAPDIPELEKLRKRWKDSEEDRSADVDRALFDLSSIVVLAQSRGRTLLLTGDARSDHILTGLERDGLLTPEVPLTVDVLKLPAHGSSRHVDPMFFARVRARHYVVSANGRDGNPDNETLAMLCDSRLDDRDPWTLWLTYGGKLGDGRPGLRERLSEFFATRTAMQQLDVRFAEPGGRLMITV